MQSNDFDLESIDKGIPKEWMLSMYDDKPDSEITEEINFTAMDWGIPREVRTPEYSAMLEAEMTDEMKANYEYLENYINSLARKKPPRKAQITTKAIWEYFINYINSLARKKPPKKAQISTKPQTVHSEGFLKELKRLAEPDREEGWESDLLEEARRLASMESKETTK